MHVLDLVFNSLMFKHNTSTVLYCERIENLEGNYLNKLKAEEAFKLTSII